MTYKNSFEPKWTTPPGATVLDLLHERKLPVYRLAQEIHTDLSSLSRLIYGVEPLTQDWAEKLSQALGASPTFWLRREELYRDDLKRLYRQVAEKESKRWLQNLPLKDMIDFGWIKQGSSIFETSLNVCAFFGVTTAEAFDNQYQGLLSNSAFHTSNAFVSQSSAIATWLRQGEIEALSIDCASWNDEKLHSSLDEIRELSKEKDPAIFLPKLKLLLANCGIAMVIARTPSGCRASGATRFFNSEKALMQFSFRYLVDDQFWFTVFHEIGHLLLHAHEELFLEELEGRISEAETEANEFAFNTLFAKVEADELDHVKLSRFDIARFARKAGVAPGIVVGQLQRRGRIPYNHFNYLKILYTW
jgi:plasmid maintenance system antidote protein VapI